MSYKELLMVIHKITAPYTHTLKHSFLIWFGINQIFKHVAFKEFFITITLDCSILTKSIISSRRSDSPTTT